MSACECVCLCVGEKPSLRLSRIHHTIYRHSSSFGHKLDDMQKFTENSTTELKDPLGGVSMDVPFFIKRCHVIILSTLRIHNIFFLRLAL